MAALLNNNKIIFETLDYHKMLNILIGVNLSMNLWAVVFNEGELL